LHYQIVRVDEIQTGFCRTGSLFAISPFSIGPDPLTMAKGIAGGFPFGGFAVKLEEGMVIVEESIGEYLDKAD